MMKKSVPFLLIAVLLTSVFCMPLHAFAEEPAQEPAPGVSISRTYLSVGEAF